jgi:hypothetical protein
MKTYSPAKVHRYGTRSVKISTTVTPSQIRFRREPSSLLRIDDESVADDRASESDRGDRDHR